MNLVDKIGRNRGKILTAIVFTMLCVASVTGSLVIKYNSVEHIESEFSKAVYGDENLWISGGNSETDISAKLNELKNEMTDMEDVKEVLTQKLIYSLYSVDKKFSAEDGQFIVYSPEQFQYKFINMKENKYTDVQEVKEGEIYISPATASEYNVRIGDEIAVFLSRDGERKSFKIAGYFEDTAMGSTLINCKRFLISEGDYSAVVKAMNEIISVKRLTRVGAILHIEQNSDSTKTISELTTLIKSDTSVGEYLEYAKSKDQLISNMNIIPKTISKYLLMAGILFGILDALAILFIEFTSARQQTLIKHNILGIVSGTAAGALIWIIAAMALQKRMIELMGILVKNSFINIKVVMFWIAFIIGSSILILLCRKVSAIGDKLCKRIIKIAGIAAALAVICVLTVMVVNANTAIDKYVKVSGVAKYDLAVKPNHRISMEDVSDIIEKYTKITDYYDIAIQSASVNENELELNVLEDTNKFKIVKGTTCNSDTEILLTEKAASIIGVKVGDSVSVSTTGKAQKYTVAGIFKCGSNMGMCAGISKEGFAKIGNTDSYIWQRNFSLSDKSHINEIVENLRREYYLEMKVYSIK